MNKQQLIGGLFRTALSGAGWIRLAHWCHQVDGRKLSFSLVYIDGEAQWNLIMLNEDGSEKLNAVSTTAEGATMQAVAALGKDGFGPPP